MLVKYFGQFSSCLQMLIAMRSNGLMRFRQFCLTSRTNGKAPLLVFVVVCSHHFMLKEMNNKSQFVSSSCTLFYFSGVWIISCEGLGLNFAGKILGLNLSIIWSFWFSMHELLADPRLTSFKQGFPPLWLRFRSYRNAKVAFTSAVTL